MRSMYVQLTLLPKNVLSFRIYGMNLKEVVGIYELSGAFVLRRRYLLVLEYIYIQLMVSTYPTTLCSLSFRHENRKSPG